MRVSQNRTCPNFQNKEINMKSFTGASSNRSVRLKFELKQDNLVRK